jgi:hypothetical protein
MVYRGGGTGEPHTVFRGESEESLDEAIRAAVGAMPEDTPEGTKLVVTYIEVTTKGDPHVGAYSVLLSKGG